MDKINSFESSFMRQEPGVSVVRISNNHDSKYKRKARSQVNVLKINREKSVNMFKSYLKTPSKNIKIIKGCPLNKQKF
jgi:hypothetical protein